MSKVEEPSKFILFESEILDVLNHRQAIMMGLLNGMAKKQGYAYIKNSTICKMLNASETSVKADLKLLEELKYIKRQVIRNDKNEVIERRIYPMSKICTEVGSESDHRVGQDLDGGGGKKRTINIDKYINIIDSKYKDTFKLWLEYKIDIKDFYKSDKSIDLLIKKIERESSPSEFAQTVEKSITNNWKGLFFEKKKNIPLAQNSNILTLDD